MINKSFIFMVFVIVFLGFVSAQVGGSFSQSVTYQPRPSFQAIYGPENINTYWPILGNKDTCQARQDLLLQISPAGCTPTVVRSDLLAEQNVPVFCQIDALQINPLIDIDRIKGIRFSGKYPNEVVAAGFHPARAALRSRDKLLGSPLINNIGYVVVVLKKNPVEKNLPDFVNVNLTSQIDYEAGNSFGVGKAEFLLEPTSDSDWDSSEQRFKQSFWNGRYFARLESADPNFAVVSIYSGDKKIATRKVERGKTSDSIWVPGAYCRAGVQIAYDGLVTAENKAIISLSDDKGTNTIDVYDGSKFLDDKCSVDKVVINGDNETGFVNIRCSGGQKIELRLGEVLNGVATTNSKLYLSDNYNTNNKIDSYIDSEKKNKAGFNFKDKRVYVELTYKTPSGIESIDNREIGKIDDIGLISIPKNDFDVAISAPGVFVSDFIKNSYDLINGAKINGKEINLNSLKNSNIVTNSELDNKFNDAVDALSKIVDEYPAEKERNVEGSQRWGEMALVRAIGLSELLGKDSKRAELLRQFIEKYPDSTFAAKYRYDFGKLSGSDFSKAGGVINVDNRFYNIRLLNLEKPKKHSNADFALTGAQANSVNVRLTESANLSGGGVGSVDSIRLDSISSEDNVRATVNCKGEKGAGGEYSIKSSSINLKLNDEATKICDKAYIRLKNVQIERIAKVRLLPQEQGTKTETNVTVNIGIEKRDIKLSPDKTEELIDNLNKSIKKWENINEKLGQVVTGLKGACFATAGVLTVKNFLTGIGGEALARQKVMPSWSAKCSDLVSSGKFKSLDACYLANSDAIDKDVSSSNEAVNQTNKRIDDLEKGYVEKDGIFGTSHVDRSKAAVAYCNDLKTRYGERDVKVKEGTKKLKDVLGECEDGYNKQGLYGYNELREIEYNLIIQDKGISESVKSNSNKVLQSSYDQIIDNKNRYTQVEVAKQDKSSGLPSLIVATGSVQKNVVGEVVPVSGVKNDKLKSVVGGDVAHLSRINVYSTPPSKEKDGSDVKGFDGGNYILGLKKNSEGFYDIGKVIKENKDGTFTELPHDEASRFSSTYGIGRITSAESVSYINPYKNPEVRYYEREPYKGMPAIVPVDVREGWYAATRQTLPAFGGIGAFDASGRVTSFYLCNVGSNGLEQFFEGYGDDICQLINLNTGQPLGFFPGLSETEAKKRVGQAVQAIQDAANQYGKKIVSVNGKDFGVGSPAANIPSTQCQNFMSPKECALLFNVCDPVICPSSRCDFGGKFPVADVVQTGIIGSTLLCLPNFVGLGGDVAIPVCLTGIHAGIEGFVSILKNHRDCLQESLATGKTVGICDQIYSVYLCEFFWRQIAPVAKVILPKIVEVAYGQGTKGGGEYLSVGAAWQSMQDSVSYFTQIYAVNSVKAFQARSVEEAGAPFCKAFISAKAPTSFKTLVQPDSPPQFSAWFSATKFTDATVPATSQYKVFYHIFAGKDQGIYFSVYLRNPPESGYYTLPATIAVASGFVGKGQYATESKDFTAPEGYKELCVRVNDKEECGFKEVSTSFALNYLSDKYSQSELQQRDIKSERECVSGSPNLAPVALSANIQAGAEEALLPQVSDRGIVRICSSRNPGSQTDPARFVDMGYCDDQKIRCWLDKQSIKNAITDNNKGVKDATLQDIESKQRADLAQKGIIVGDDVAAAEIKELKNVVDSVRHADKIVDSDVSQALVRLDALFNRTILNHQKANILYLIGDLKGVVVEKNVRTNKVEESKKAGAADISVVDKPSVTTPTPQPSASGQATYSLNKIYNGDINLELIETKNGDKVTILTIEKTKIYPVGKGSSIIIGRVNPLGNGNYEIKLYADKDFETFRDYFFDKEIKDENLLKLYYKFKDAIIDGKDIIFH